MSAALHKGSSTTARGARLGLAAPEKPKAMPERDPRDLEIARLKVERDELQQTLLQAERQRALELDEIRDEARKTAALEFEQDDARRVELLAGALHKSVALFETELIVRSRQLAPALARGALERLVRGQEAEIAWLIRVIERRLEALGQQAVISMHIAAEEFSEDVARQLSRRLGASVAVAADPSLRPGSARISLRLGEILIDPAAGADQLLAAMREPLDD